MPDNLGESVYKLTVENAQLKQGFDEANAKLREYEANANKADQASSRLGQGMKSVDDAVGKATRTVTKFVGAFGAIGGVAVGAYALGTALRQGVISALEDGADKAKRFHDSLDFTKPTEALAAMDKQAATLSNNLAAQAEGGGGMIARILFGEDSPEELKAQLDDINKRAASVRKQLRAQQEQKETADESKRVASLEKARDDARSASLEGAEKIEFDSTRKVADLQAQLDKERNAKARAALEETISWEHQKRNQALSDLAVKEQRDKEKAQQEQQRKAEQAQQAATDELFRQRMGNADAEQKARLQYEHDIAELARRLAAETNEDTRKALIEAMEEAGESLAKKLEDAVKKFSTELLKIQQQLQSENNNVIFGSLSAIARSIDDMKMRVGPGGF